MIRDSVRRIITNINVRAKQRILLNELNRQWTFDSLPHFLFAKNGVFLTASSQEGDLIVSPDGTPFIRSACVGFSIIFNIFDPLKFQPKINLTGQYGSARACLPSRQWNFEYSYMSPATRKLAMDFMDSIPNGSIVVVRNILNNNRMAGLSMPGKQIPLYLGITVHLYHKLKDIGFNKIDSFNSATGLHLYL